MLVEIKHFIPGRVRLRAPELFCSGHDPATFLPRMVPEGAIRSIRCNPHCHSVVIEFDHDFPGPITDLVRTLRRLSDGKLIAPPPETALASARGPEVAAPEKRKRWWNWPLVWPESTRRPVAVTAGRR